MQKQIYSGSLSAYDVCLMPRLVYLVVTCCISNNVLVMYHFSKKSQNLSIQNCFSTLNCRRPLILMTTPICPRLLNMINEFVLLRFRARTPEDLSAIEVIYLIYIYYYYYYITAVEHHCRQCLIQDQIFTSPSPGAVDPRARARTSAACAPRAHERRALAVTASLSLVNCADIIT